MNKQLLHRIYWDKVTNGNSYLYGSTIEILEGMVLFTNLRIASGKSISKWTSETNYQKDRQSPQLPLLKPGSSYNLSLVLESTPTNRTFVQIDFFNRQGEKIGFEILRKTQQDFVYPKEAFTYTITLKSGGCQAIKFSYIEIYQYQVKKSLKLESSSKKCYKNEELPVDLQFVTSLIRTI